MDLCEALWFTLLGFWPNDGEAGGGDAGGETRGKAGFGLGAPLLGHSPSEQQGLSL